VAVAGFDVIEAIAEIQNELMRLAKPDETTVECWMVCISPVHVPKKLQAILAMSIEVHDTCP
jgi:hypothetical protein